MNVSLRPAVPEDFDFLYGLNRATMKEYVVETWGQWDEPWQEEKLPPVFPACRLQSNCARRAGRGDLGLP